MLIGNGRHRRPRQAPALLVTAGVTGSAIALPLLSAGAASAADGTTWDHVAQCESGGSWSADTGNGRYGGLQLTQEEWDKYGGLDYAPSADQASRSQQIAVAEKILAHRGVSAWSSCARSAGLSKDSRSAHVDTGVAGDSSNGASDSDADGDSGLSDSNSGGDSGLSGSSGSAATDSPSPSSSPSSSSHSSSSSSPSSSPPSSESTANSAKSDSGGGVSRGSDSSASSRAKGDESDKSVQSGTSWIVDTGEISGAGRHRGGAADEADQGAKDGRTGDAAGRHASRGSGGARDAVDGSYTVRPGDSLSTIADSHDVKGGWAALYGANKKAVGADPDLIHPGQSLTVDAKSTGKQR